MASFDSRVTMKLSSWTLLAPLLPLVLCQDTDLSTVEKAFANANIPETLTITFRPTALLEVTLPQTGAAPITLNAGVQLPRNATAGPPTFAVVGNVGPGPFVLAMVDPDAPTPQTPTEAQIRHFLGSDFFPDFPNFGNVHPLTNNTPAISEFLQPTPPAGSDPHRYVLLLFKQPAGFDLQTLVNSTTSIQNFNISTFAAATKLGNPIAGTFMRVGPDPTTA